jgi:hypothetical protein
VLPEPSLSSVASVTRPRSVDIARMSYSEALTSRRLRLIDRGTSSKRRAQFAFYTASSIRNTEIRPGSPSCRSVHNRTPVTGGRAGLPGSPLGPLQELG